MHNATFEPVLATGEIPPCAMSKYVADQIGADPSAFTTYARREETRSDHIARLMIFLDVGSAEAQQLRICPPATQ